MVALKAGEVAGALRKPDPRYAIYLFYGPDTGLVSERAGLVASRFVNDPADPFQMVKLEGDVVAADPPRLADEAGTVGLFGDKRTIWVSSTSRNIAPAVDNLLKAPLQDTLVVIEAGDLAKSSPLRVACERSPLALALPCYPDEGRGLGDLVDESLREAQLSIDKEARALLLANLGGDRLASRAELAKLILYCSGQKTIAVEDIDAVLSDVSSLASDAVIDAAFVGDFAALEIGARRLAAEGIAASTLLGSALRHGFALLTVRLDMEGGRSADHALESWRGLHFKRKPFVQRQLQRWTSQSLKAALSHLQASVLQTRRLAHLGDTVASKVLLDLARSARSKP